MTEYSLKTFLVLVLLIFIGIMIYSLKYVMIYLLGLICPSYKITISPEKTIAVNNKTGDSIRVKNLFFTHQVESSANTFHEVIIEADLETTPEHVLEQEFHQQYRDVRKYRFDHTYGRADEFRRVILQVNVFKKLKSSFIPIIFGNHTVYFKEFDSDQLQEVRKSIKKVMINAKLS
ncbi:hypothetical protein [Alkanindiges illinoisensis]|uniref:Uncharacterized protein n=1 Tax=Alkanindiges illinoisensis TaxID=197183 RepID=A0A4Y7X9Z4_9GAMM|nr:hypothetical protein [Alkanindiges illinoisensis]TEU23893.1 hypothetical protein E2B99_13250 [Alkanindiges illinoisensis]